MSVNDELNSILESCKTFASQFEDPEGEDHYGFLVSIGSNIGKIKKELNLD